MTGLGFVTGLQAESRLIQKLATRHMASGSDFCAGASAARAEFGVKELVGTGAEAVVSFGLCGGLDPSLPAGTLILADSVVDRAGHGYAADAGLRVRILAELLSAGLNPIAGRMLGDDRAAASAAQKTKLFGETGAVALDMESHGVARGAVAAGVPFLIVRAVADPAQRDLPHAALAATASDGGVNIAAVMTALLRRPWELGAMLRLARDARAGFAALERALPALLGGG